MVSSQKVYDFFNAEERVIPLWLNAGLVVLFSAFVVFRLYMRDVFHYFEPFFYLGLLYVCFRYGEGLRRFLLVVLVVAIVIPILSWLMLIQDFPRDSITHFRSEDFLDKFIYLFMGFFLYLNKKKIPLFLLLTSLVVLFIPFATGDGFNEIKKGLAGYRVDFGLVAIRTALLFGLVFVGFTIYAILSKSRLAIRLILVFLSFFCLVIIFITQTRSAIVGLVFFLLFLIYIFFREGTSLRMKLYFLLLLFFLTAAGYFSGLANPLLNRFEFETVTFSKFYESHDDFSQLPNSSMGLRLQFWHAAINYGMERPVLGWGYEGGNKVMELSGVISEKNTFINTVHNGFLELFVRYGLLGVFFFLGVMSFVLVFFYKAVRAGLVPRWVSFYVPASLIYFNCIAMFTSDYFYWQSLYAFNIIMAVAAAYSYTYIRDIRKGKNYYGG